MSDCVFISYARKDQDFVLRLGEKLKERTVSVWLDQWNIPAGGDWDQVIDSALHECNRFLIILSPAAVASRQVRGELQTALDENKVVVPLLYKRCPIPRVLRLIQHIDFTGADLNDEFALDQVVRALGTFETAFRQTRHRSSRLLWRNRQRVIVSGTLAAGLLLVGSAWFVWHSHSVTRPLDKQAQDSLPSAPAYGGKLQVSANIDNAKVSIDGTVVGVARRVAPLFLTGIKPGQHRIRVEAEGYEPQERRINIVENEWSQVGFALNRRLAQ